MTATDPRARLDEIKARSDAATEGPWTPMEFDEDPHDWGVAILGGGERGTMDAHLTAYTMTMNNVEQTEADAEFIAHARTDNPAMADALTAVLDLYKHVTYPDEGDPYLTGRADGYELAMARVHREIKHALGGGRG